MHFVFSTGSLYNYSVARCFELAAAAGFDGVEIMVDHRIDTRQPSYLKRLAEQHHLPISTIHSPFGPPYPGWPSQDIGRIQKAVELAEAVGASVVVHHLPLRIGAMALQVFGRRQIFLPIPGWRMDRDYKLWLETDYMALQARTDVKLCIENMPARRLFGERLNIHYWNDPAQIIRFPNITLDTTHLGTWGLEPAEIYPHLGGRVGHVHLSNFDGKEHRRPQAGRLHLDKLVAQLAADGYNGAVSLELHPDALEAGAEDSRVVELLTESLSQCRSWAAM